MISENRLAVCGKCVISVSDDVPDDVSQVRYSAGSTDALYVNVDYFENSIDLSQSTHLAPYLVSPREPRAMSCCLHKNAAWSAESDHVSKHGNYFSQAQAKSH